jgi:anti-sigma B factor antagonist
MAEIQVIHTGAQATLIIGEKLVASEVPILKNEMKRLIGEGVTFMVLNCTNLLLLDSTGIGCLVAAHNSLVKNNGSLSLIQISQDIYDLLCSMRIDRHIQITLMVEA